MAQSVVFLIHGMGEHYEDTDQKKGWHHKWVTTLQTHFDTLEGTSLTKKSFKERYEFIPITYDGVLRKHLKNWQQEGAKLSEAEEELGANDALVKQLRRGLEAAGGDKFFWTHAADVLLYRALPNVREQVRVHVAKIIIDKLVERATPVTGALPSWGVIAHSLGTAVVHDALHAMWTGNLTHPDLERVSSKKHDARAKLVAMIANVSRILQDPAVKVFESIVMPGPAGSLVPKSGLSDSEWVRGCNYFLSARHRLDPFTRPKPFQPDTHPWPDQQAVTEGFFLHINDLFHIHEANVHSFEHYLADPRVHIPILELFYRDGSVGEPHKKKAQEEFKKEHPLSAVFAEKLRDRLEGLRSHEKIPWAELGDLRRRFEEQVLAMGGE